MSSSAVLWDFPPASCTLARHDDGLQPFEIRVYVAGVVVVEEFFGNDTAAADFAIAQMHIYETFGPRHHNGHSVSS